MTELGRRLPDARIDGCKLRLDRRRPNVVTVTNGWYTLVGQSVVNEQKDVGPTSLLRTYSQRLHVVWGTYVPVPQLTQNVQITFPSRLVMGLLTGNLMRTF